MKSRFLFLCLLGMGMATLDSFAGSPSRETISSLAMPSPTPNPTPRSTPEPTPAPIPTATPGATPEATPGTSPSATPQPTGTLR